MSNNDFDRLSLSYFVPTRRYSVVGKKTDVDLVGT
jgi:hypothetical protein